MSAVQESVGAPDGTLSEALVYNGAGSSAYQQQAPMVTCVPMTFPLIRANMQGYITYVMTLDVWLHTEERNGDIWTINTCIEFPTESVHSDSSQVLQTISGYAYLDFNGKEFIQRRETILIPPRLIRKCENPPGRMDDSPGCKGANTPGRIDYSLGRIENTPGRSENTPGRMDENTPGLKDDSPGCKKAPAANYLMALIANMTKTPEAPTPMAAPKHCMHGSDPDSCKTCYNRAHRGGARRRK